MGDQVLSVDSQGVAEYKKVTGSAMTNKNAEVIKLSCDVTGNTITCTPEHEVFTKNRGYVKAMNLKPNDELLFKDTPHGLC